MNNFQRGLAHVAISSAILAASPARAAAPPSSPMLVVGIGEHSCREFLRTAVANRQARPAHPNAADQYAQDRYFRADYGLYMLWVDGYLTAANSYDTDKRTSGQNTTHVSRMQWLEKYCGDHPQSLFVAAVNALHQASDVPATGATSFEPSDPLPEPPKEKLTIVNHNGARYEFHVETAITPDQWETGLMFPPDRAVGVDEQHVEAEDRVLHPHPHGPRAAEIEQHSAIGGWIALAHHRAYRAG